MLRPAKIRGEAEHSTALLQKQRYFSLSDVEGLERIICCDSRSLLSMVGLIVSDVEGPERINSKRIVGRSCALSFV